MPIIIGLVLLVAGFSLAGFVTVQESTRRTLQERLTVAQVTADRVDDLLERIVQMTEWVAEEHEFDLENPSLAANREALQYLNDHLDGMAFFVGLMNREGVKVWTEPYRDDIVGVDYSGSRTIQDILGGRGPIITRVISLAEDEYSVAVGVGIEDPDGTVTGIITVDLDLSHEQFADLLNPIGLDDTSYVEIVDQNGIVLVSTRTERQLQNVDRAGHFATLIENREMMVGECHDCHQGAVVDQPATEIVAFAPLTSAPWGVAVRQSKDATMAYSTLLRTRSVAIGGAAALVALTVTVIISKQLVSPVESLAVAVKGIAEGDLDRPIPTHNVGELAQCAQCVEQIRTRLKDSIEEIQEWSQELELKVRQRTEELETSEQARRELLHKVVVAQEEERQRLARELHDQTSQSLTALMVGLETVVMRPAETPEEVKEYVVAVKPQVQELLGEINRIVMDLRPLILDDLGLVQAIDWLVENRLESVGIRSKVWTIGPEKRLPSEVETIVYRIVQEAITNIIRHAQPKNVNITLSFRDTHSLLTIEDDGVGFSLAEADRNGDGRVRHGLLGMKERAALIGANLTIISRPGRGTRIVCEIPYQARSWEVVDA